MKQCMIVLLLAACAASGAAASGLRGRQLEMGHPGKGPISADTAKKSAEALAKWVADHPAAENSKHQLSYGDYDYTKFQQTWAPFRAWQMTGNKFNKHMGEALNAKINTPDPITEKGPFYEVERQVAWTQAKVELEMVLRGAMQSPPAGMTANDVKDGFCAANGAPQHGEFIFKCDLPGRQDDTWAYYWTGNTYFPPSCDQHADARDSLKGCRDGCVAPGTGAWAGQTVPGNCYPVDNRCNSVGAPQDGSTYWTCSNSDETYAYYDMRKIPAKCDQHAEKAASQKACVQGCTGSGECKMVTKKEQDKSGMCVSIMEPIMSSLTSSGACAVADTLLGAACAETIIAAVAEAGLNPVADAMGAVCGVVEIPFSIGCDGMAEAIVDATSTGEHEAEKFCESIFG